MPGYEQLCAETKREKLRGNSVKDSRGQPKNGTLKQAIEK